MKKIFFTACILILLVSFTDAKQLKIARDKTPIKNGPGNFYDNIVILKNDTIVNYIEDSKENSLWINISYNKQKGFISKISLKSVNSEDMFSEFDKGLNDNVKHEIAPASYTAAIKGFVIKYSNKKGYSVKNYDDLIAITEFKTSDLIKYRNETKLSYFPKEGELLGDKKTFINQNIEAIGLSASIDVLNKGVVFDKEMSKRLNVIANILLEQTYDYDSRYRLWIIKDNEPTVFSGPGGYIFISDKLLKIIDDPRELTAIIAHEIGHIIFRHGIKDIALEQSRYSAEKSFDELDENIESDDSDEIVIEDMESIIKTALNSIKLVHEDQEEFQSDDIACELLKRYKIDKKYLLNALNKIDFALGSQYPDYKKQIEVRIERLKKSK